MTAFTTHIDRWQRTLQHRHETPRPRIDPRSHETDQQRARNIPIIGRAAGGGHIPGTRPDQLNHTRHKGRRR